MSDDGSSHDFVLEVDVKSPSIPDGQEEFGYVVGVKGT